MRHTLSAALSAALLASAAPAWAQTTAIPVREVAPAAATPTPTPTPTSTSTPTLTPPADEPLRFGRSQEHSVGLRVWMFAVPSWMVGLFASVNDSWSGATNIAIGPEYTYRRGNLDVVIGLQYTGLQAEDGFFHGSSEGDIATERVKSSLWALYANALFLWNVRPTDWFEFQYGAGVGLGYVGGNLYRNQVYRNPPPAGAYQDCQSQGVPDGSYCDRANQHYGSYTEPYLTNGGSIPPVIPWISLPHLALHFRPHRRFDIRLDGGFALIGFYGGAAIHYVF